MAYNHIIKLLYLLTFQIADYFGRRITVSTIDQHKMDTGLYQHSTSLPYINIVNLHCGLSCRCSLLNPLPLLLPGPAFIICTIKPCQPANKHCRHQKSHNDPFFYCVQRNLLLLHKMSSINTLLFIVSQILSQEKFLHIPLFKLLYRNRL